MRKTYDFILGVGEGCTCATILRIAKLQFETMPFDWLFGPGIVRRLELIANNMENFIDIKYLKYIESGLNDVYYHEENQIYFSHDFPLNADLKSVYSSVNNKYERRIKRLYSKFENASEILIVYIEVLDTNNKMPTHNELIDSHKLLMKRFPGKTIDIVYLKNDVSMRVGDLQEVTINDNIKQLILNYESGKTSALYWMIDERLVIDVLQSKIKLRTSIKEKIESNILLIGRENNVRTIFFLPVFNRILSLRVSILNKQIELSLGKLRGPNGY